MASNQLSYSLFFILTIGVLALLSGCSHEPLHQTATGEYRGSGVVQYYYEGTSNVMREDAYTKGKLTTSTWYKPSGTPVATTNWGEAGQGMEYHLFDDGSVSRLIQMNNGHADGEGWRFDRSGRHIAIDQYKEGVLVESISLSTFEPNTD